MPIADFATANRFYIAAGGGIAIIILFLIWGVGLIKLITSGQESRLQNEYGTEADIKRQKQRKARIVRLLLGAIVIAGLAVIYWFIL